MRTVRSWIDRLEFEFGRHGLVGLMAKLRGRLIGPSRRQLLRRIDALSEQVTTQSHASTDRLDATLRYVVDTAARESEVRIATAVAASQPDAPSAEAVAALAASLDNLRGEFEAYRRSQALMIVDPQSDLMLVSDYGFDIMVPVSERGLLLHFLRTGLKRVENGVRQVILDNVKAGDVAIDIGANVGLHAVLMARLVGANGQLYAFEPHPQVVRALRQTIAIGGFSGNVTIEEKIVCDKDGETDFWIGEHSPVSSIFAASGESYKRTTTSLDAYLAPGSRVDFVKIDAEGAEPLILAGMRRILADNQAIRLVMEVSRGHFERSGFNMADFHRDLLERGFSVSSIRDDGAVIPVEDTQAFARLENANILLARA